MNEMYFYSNESSLNYECWCYTCYANFRNCDKIMLILGTVINCMIINEIHFLFHMLTDVVSCCNYTTAMEFNTLAPGVTIWCHRAFVNTGSGNWYLNQC